MDFTVCLLKVGGFWVFKVYILQVRDIDFKVCLLKVEGDLAFSRYISYR